jgi:hypothetical protein
MVDRDALRTEALRIHRRYALEVVEAFSFCPWAAGARTEGRVQTRVVFGAEPDLKQTLHEVESLEYDESADIGLLVFPELRSDRIAFQHFAARVREQLEARYGRGRAPFALADFHPDAHADLGSPERLVAFIRRTPDPTLQLLRHSALDAVRRGEQPGTRFVDPAQLAHAELAAPQTEPLHQRLARANRETVLRHGVEHVAAVIADILSDRDRSYGRLGVPAAAWNTHEQV